MPLCRTEITPEQEAEEIKETEEYEKEVFAPLIKCTVCEFESDFEEQVIKHVSESGHTMDGNGRRYEWLTEQNQGRIIFSPSKIEQ